MICFKCKVDKIENDFYIRSDNGRRSSYCKKCTTDYNKSFHLSNTPKERERSRLKHYKQKYGITWDDKVRMYEEQKGLCACCFKKLPPVRNVGVHVDHNHSTGQVRALIHRDCNWAIGWIEKHPELPKFVFDYLAKFSIGS